MNTITVKQKLRRRFLLQGMAALVSALFSWWWFNAIIAYSVVLGSAVFIIPTVLFAEIAFRHHGARAAKQIMMNFYWGEALKMVVAVALFAVVCATQTVSTLAFFIAYLINQLIMVGQVAFL